MRIVADTNTLVSGFGWGGPPGQVIDTVLSGQVTLVISPALLGELARVVAYPKLTAIFDDPSALVAAVAEAALSSLRIPVSTAAAPRPQSRTTLHQPPQIAGNRDFSPNLYPKRRCSGVEIVNRLVTASN